MRADSPVRHGSALIEALLSLVLLGTVGTSLLMLLSQTRTTMRAARATELTIDSAGAALERLVGLDREELRRRTGWMLEDGMAVDVEPESSTLFEVKVTRAPGERVLLATTLYRRDTSDAR